MGILEIEQATITKLRADIPGRVIEAFPDSVEAFRSYAKSGAILVSYEGTRFEAAKAQGFANASAYIQFRVSHVHKSFRSHQGAYESLDQVRESLVGFQIMGLGKIRIVEEKFFGQNNQGLWYYTQVFEMRGRVVEAA